MAVGPWVFVASSSGDVERPPSTRSNKSEQSEGSEDGIESKERAKSALEHDESDDASSNGELTAPLAEIIEKQRRMSESAQLLNDAENSNNSNDHSTISKYFSSIYDGLYTSGWALWFAAGVATGYILRALTAK